MWNQLSDVAPKAVVAAVLVWSGANYLVIAPNVATRVAAKDFVPACTANLQAWAADAGKKKEQALPVPFIDPAQEMAMNRLRAMQNNPLMREFNNGPLGDLLGVGASMEMAAAQYAQRKQQAQDAYNKAKDMIRQETAIHLGKAEGTCGCLADAAFDAKDWAIFTGTLGFLRPSSVAQFGAKMQQVYDTGACAAGKAGS